MSKQIKKRLKKVGLPPGTLIHVGDKRPEKVIITLFDYDQGGFQEREAKTIEECIPFKDKPTVTWINVDGLYEVELLGKLGSGFGIHPLIMEDILYTGQRPKMEDFSDHIYIVLKMFYPNGKNEEIVSEQMSIVLGVNFVITFQETHGDIFDSIRARIRSGKGRIRKMGADYLAYAVLDAIADNYFIVLEKFSQKLEFLEEGALKDTSAHLLKKVQYLKKDILYLRQSVWPLRDVIHALGISESPLIRESTVIYLRDISDHVTQCIDTIETFRDSLSSIYDVYLTNTNNRLNAIIKVLTIISTIFMPLNFIAGIYGMNFKHMPELDSPLGYPIILGIMLIVVITMLVFFKKKSWL